MAIPLPNTRAFEHVPFSGEPARSDLEGYKYAPVMSIVFRHTYYNQSGHRCPDFTVAPTPASAGLMHDTGLLFLQQKDGFSVLANESQRGGLLNYLRLQAQPPCADGNSQVWTRLSFVLICNNPEFVNFTDIGINEEYWAKHFYFSNQKATAEESEGIRESKAERATLPAPGQLLPVIPVQYGVDVCSPAIEEPAVKVLVQAISGETVLCRPRCIPAGLVPFVNPATMTCEEVCQYKQSVPRRCAEKCKGSPDPDCLKKCQDELKRPECTCTIYLDFAPLPEGKYTIVKVGRSGGEQKREVLYATPAPLCFIDLLFTDPIPKGPGIPGRGIYPVRDLCQPAETKVVSVTYELRFEARATVWIYYIVPSSGRLEFGSLHILCLSKPLIGFGKPLGPIFLSNGDVALWFISDRPILLEEKPICNLQLKDAENALVERLPVASITQVLPEFKFTAAARGGGKLPPPPGGSLNEQSNTYSDIFVYV